MCRIACRRCLEFDMNIRLLKSHDVGASCFSSKMSVGGVPSLISLDKLLDQKPPLSEVCEYGRTSRWYKLGVQLKLDKVELKEIRSNTGSDKRTLMYQLWLCSQRNATRRQLLTALRTRYVREKTVAHDYQQMLNGMVSVIIYTCMILKLINKFTTGTDNSSSHQQIY